MSYVIWKLFMKQYARLRLPSNNNSNGNGGRPTLIWHTYAAIEGTVRECRRGWGERVARLGMAMEMEIEQ